jgi:maltooligosyltrehalose trehalohydrolase
LNAHWQMADGTTLRLLANLSDREITGAPEATGTLIWGRALSGHLPAWAVRWHIG